MRRTVRVPELVPDREVAILGDLVPVVRLGGEIPAVVDADRVARSELRDGCRAPPGPNTATSSTTESRPILAPVAAPESTKRSAPRTSTPGAAREPDRDGDGVGVAGPAPGGVDPAAGLAGMRAPRHRPRGRPARPRSSSGGDLEVLPDAVVQQRGGRLVSQITRLGPELVEVATGPPRPGPGTGPGRRASPWCGARTTTAAGSPCGSPRGGHLRSSASRPSNMSPLPPGSTASTIWSKRSRKIRWACMRTVNMFGMAIGDPMT